MSSGARALTVASAPPSVQARRNSLRGISSHTACCRKSAMKSWRSPLSGEGSPTTCCSRARSSRPRPASRAKRSAARAQAPMEPRACVGTPCALKTRSQRCNNKRSSNSCRPSSSPEACAVLPRPRCGAASAFPGRLANAATPHRWHSLRSSGAGSSCQSAMSLRRTRRSGVEIAVGGRLKLWYSLMSSTRSSDSSFCCRTNSLSAASTEASRCAGTPRAS
mmetsp:Transcript_125595/g.366902  ORF Transcript_125595/g.366902 Transcript_125595/m.366902 type:complete len:221 (-) Transcript_125595:62-724(-)